MTEAPLLSTVRLTLRPHRLEDFGPMAAFFASDAARAARDFAFGVLGWTTAVSYIDRDNAPSVALARRLGAVEDPQAARWDDKDAAYRHPAPEPRA